MRSTRPWWVWLHRWVGLVAGLLMALLGLSGALMVWQAELDRALNPAWLGPQALCPGPAPVRPVAATLAVLQRSAPQARPAIVLAPDQPGAAWRVWEARDPRTGWRREHFIDPVCGRALGWRDRGAPRADRAHLVPALYELHSHLLAGETGHRLVGSGGLLLLGLSLSGAWLAWPRPSSRAAWRRTLGIRTDGSRVRLWFDVHRVLGLWGLPVALLLSVTGAMMVFKDSSRALVGAVWRLQPAAQIARADAPTDTGVLPPDALVARGEAVFPGARWSRLSLPARPGAPWELRLLQAGEPRADTGNTRVRLGADGRLLSVQDPLHSAPGNRVLDWVFPLHSAEALGGLARLLWTVFGLLPAVLLGSAAWLWWRRGRQRRAALRACAPRSGASAARSPADAE